MSPAQRSSALAIALAVLSLSIVSSASAQDIEIREVKGKQVACVRIGPIGLSHPCGTHGVYEDVFIGTIISASPAWGDELQLNLMPEEVFIGHPTAPLTAETSQANCLPEIQPGARWLIYLLRNNETNKLYLEWAPSKPVAEAEDDIALLRRLPQMTDSGLVTGDVTRATWEDAKWVRSVAVADHEIVARRVSDGAQYSTFTNSNGHYELGPLPAGSYRITPSSTLGLSVNPISAKIEAGGCSMAGFSFAPDGRVSGHVTMPDGKPAQSVQVAMVPAPNENSAFTSAITDQHGYFEITELHPGRYFVGINIQPPPDNAQGQSRVYYPGVREKELALTINLGPAEHRSDVDFQIPDGIVLHPPPPGDNIMMSSGPR